MSKLTYNDYKQILEFYNETIPKSKHILKIKANNIIANKLCCCITKYISPQSISNKKYKNKKSLTRGKFKKKTRKNKF